MTPAEATQAQTLAASKHAKQACPGSLPAARLCHTAATHREGHLCSWCQGTRVGQHEKTLGGRKLVTVLRTGARELGGLGRREGGHLAQKGHSVVVFRPAGASSGVHYHTGHVMRLSAAAALGSSQWPPQHSQNLSWSAAGCCSHVCCGVRYLTTRPAASAGAELAVAQAHDTCRSNTGTDTCCRSPPCQASLPWLTSSCMACHCRSPP